MPRTATRCSRRSPTTASPSRARNARAPPSTLFSGMGRSRAAAAIAIALCASLFVAACSGDDDDTTTKAEPRGPLSTITPGVLTVGTELPAPTFWDSADYRTVRHGYEADIVHELARRLGKLKVKIVEYPFVGINAGAPCDCDITFSQIGITK